MSKPTLVKPKTRRILGRRPGSRHQSRPRRRRRRPLAAARTWDATSLFASRFVYSTCYTLSYGVVFPAMLLARAIPRNNEAVRGLIDGAHAAILKVDQIRGMSIDTAVPAPSPA